MALTDLHPLPQAPDRDRWAYSEQPGARGGCRLVYRVVVGEDAGPALPPEQAQALPMLLHELDRQEGLARALTAPSGEEGARELGAPPKAVLVRLLPRLVSYRFVDTDSARAHEFVFEGYRAMSLHVLARVLESEFRFRLEDLSHFATHGEFMLRVLHAVGLSGAIDPEGILYCPAVDSPFPFKFAVVGSSGRSNRDAYVSLLRQLLRNTEADEVFRARNFRELIRGFAKFGPASATPGFQEAELRIWRVLSYLAARLRVKAGRLTDTKDTGEVRTFLGELRGVHVALDELVNLPSRMAAFYRSRFDLELSSLYEYVLEELDAIAAKIDLEFDQSDRSIDKVAAQVSEFRRLGSASPLETLEENDRDIKLAYGDVDVEALETGWERTYTEKIFTGAERFDTRRYDAVKEGEDLLSEEDMDLGVDLSFGFAGGGHDEGSGGEAEGEGDGDDAELESDFGLDELDFGF